MDADLIVGAVMHIDPYSSAVQTISFTRYSLPTFIASTLDDIESSRTLSWQYKVTEHQITEDVKEQYQISPILASSSLFGALIFPYKGSPAASDVLIDKVMYLGAECKSGSSNFRLL